MIDYFALLDQPRRPWLDPEELKQAFHAKTRTAHPDTRPVGMTADKAEAAFAQVNEAYQVLQDPRRRLHHLLGLEDRTPTSSPGVIPPEVASMFQPVATATQETERIVQRMSAATNPLSRSLLQAGLVEARAGVEQVLRDLQRLFDEAEMELRAMNTSDAQMDESQLDRLQQLYVRFAFLTRWIAQLEEKQTQLATR